MLVKQNKYEQQQFTIDQVQIEPLWLPQQCIIAPIISCPEILDLYSQ